MAQPVFDRLGAEGLLIELSSLVTIIRNATEKAGPLAEDMTGALYFLAPRARAGAIPRRYGVGAEQAGGAPVNRRAFVQGLAALATLPRTHRGTRLRFRVHHVLNPVDGV